MACPRPTQTRSMPICWRFSSVRIRHGDGKSRAPWILAIAFFLALVGLAMAVYLVSVRGSTGSQFGNRNSEEISMALSGGNGIIDIPSNHSVDETVDKLKGILVAKGITLFALVDHSGEAEKVGMKM